MYYTTKRAIRLSWRQGLLFAVHDEVNVLFAVLLQVADQLVEVPVKGEALHHRDIEVLLVALNRLISKGHTVIIIEHNPAVIVAADHVIDLGPEGGKEGGNIVCAGTPEQVAQCKESYTGKYLAKIIYNI